VALLLGLGFSSNGLGRLLLVPVQIQFHELGHAMMAWLSSRAALPLPFGFTFWREQRSPFVGLCMLFLLGVLVVRSDRERSRFGVSVGLCLAAAWFYCSCVLSAARTLELTIAGGIAGEFVLTSLVMVAFYFPLPDRLRWDFFRFLLVLPAASAWLASARLWLGVYRGTAPLPMGSILGTPGDGSGDLDRLIDVYGHAPHAITRTMMTLCVGSALIFCATYAFFGARALQQLRDDHAARATKR
jgi:hypothetical protein